MRFVEGIDYSPAGILALRESLIAMRGEAYKQFPESIGFVVIISHTIALLSDYAEMREKECATPVTKQV